MNAEKLCEKCGFTPIALPSPEKEVDGAYVGDLLSWVMGRADAGNLWITIMSNVNVIAVASLTDVSAIILAEDVVLDEEVLSVATAKGVNVLSSTLPVYETALAVSHILS